MLRFGPAFFLAFVLGVLPASAQTGDIYIVGVAPLVVQNAGGCKRMDSASVRCSIKHGQYTYVYFEVRRPKFEQCSLAVSRGPGERWRVNASPCVARWNGNHVYISVRQK